MAMPDVPTGQGSVKLSRDEFSRGVRARFDDPIFDGASREIDRVVDLVWKAYGEWCYEPYATSHEALDGDAALHVEIRDVARALVERVKLARAGRLRSPGEDLREPRPK
jgi:hypothetical protein